MFTESSRDYDQQDHKININNDIEPRLIRLGLVVYKQESEDSADEDSVSKLIRLRVSGITPTLSLFELIWA